MIYYQIQTSKGKLIAGNMHEFPHREEFEDKKNFFIQKKGAGIRSTEVVVDDIKVWVVATNETDLLKSSKLFNKAIELYKQIALDVWRYHQTQINAHAHTLTTIHGQIRQSIEGFAPDERFYGETYTESTRNIAQLVSNDVGSAADLICYVYKRVADMRAHMLGAEIVHNGAQYEVKFSTVSLKRAILNQCTPFLSELESNSVRLKFFFDEGYEVQVDKNMFSLVMYNFFSNSVKYSKSNSEIRLHYIQDKDLLDISMISLKMEKNELSNLSQEGVRGRHAKNIPGKGIGLFVLQNALNLMRKKPMYIDPNYEESFIDDGHTYNENHFQFFL